MKTWGLLSKYKLELYGFSIIWIMIYHGNFLNRITHNNQFVYFISNFLDHGNCGVDIFLFLSGIFCFYSMKNHKGLKEFYQKRMVRLFFPVVIIYGFYWAYDCILKKHNLILFIEKITSLYFWLNGERSIWFIALIVPLYFFYPLLYNKFLTKYSEKTNWLIVLGMCVSICLFVCLGKLYFFPLYKAYEIAITRIPVFLIGSCLGIYVYEDRPISLSVLIFSFLVMILGILAFGFKMVPVVSFFRVPYLLTAPCLALWICILLDYIRLPGVNQILSMFGEVSLELYLSHLVVREIAKHVQLWGSNNLFNFVKYLFFVVLASYTISKIVNILFQQMLKKISKRKVISC